MLRQPIYVHICPTNRILRIGEYSGGELTGYSFISKVEYKDALRRGFIRALSHNPKINDMVMLDQDVYKVAKTRNSFMVYLEGKYQEEKELHPEEKACEICK